MKVFYFIENNKVVGFQTGTDIPGEPSSTKARADEWAAAAAGRQIVVKNFIIESKLIIFENGDVREATKAERDADQAGKDTAEQTERQRIKALKDSIIDKLSAATYTPLTKEEIRFILK